MLLLPHRNDTKKHFESPDITYFNNYNQIKFIEIFQSFPYNSCKYVLNKFIDLLCDNIDIKDRFKIHTLSLNDVIFANETIGNIIEDGEKLFKQKIDLQKMLNDGDIKAFRIEYIHDIYYNFFIFENYTFDKPDFDIASRNNIDMVNAEEGNYHLYTLNYSISSSLGKDKDVRMVDFFIDSKYNTYSNIIDLYTKLVDSMIMEYLRRASKFIIPFNSITNFAPPYIAFSEFITVDAINFIYEYILVMYTIFDEITVNFSINGKDHEETNITNILKNANERDVLKNSGIFFNIDNTESLSHAIWEVLIGDNIDSTNAIRDLYLAYKNEMNKR